MISLTLLTRQIAFNVYFFAYFFFLLVIRFGDVETTTNYKRDLPFSAFLWRKSVTVVINLERNSNYIFIKSVKEANGKGNLEGFDEEWVNPNLNGNYFPNNCGSKLKTKLKFLLTLHKYDDQATVGPEQIFFYIRFPDR